MKTEIKVYMSWPNIRHSPGTLLTPKLSPIYLSVVFWDNLQRSFWYVCIILYCVTQTQPKVSLGFSYSTSTNTGCAACRERGSVFGIKLPYNAQLPSWGSSLSRYTVPFDCFSDGSVEHLEAHLCVSKWVTFVSEGAAAQLMRQQTSHKAISFLSKKTTFCL